MPLQPPTARRFLCIGALSAAISVLLLAVIIPLTRTNPLAASEWPVDAFWICLGFNGLTAAILSYFAFRIVSVTPGVALVFGLLMVLALLIAFVLTDAAFAFHSHGPALRTAAILLHFSSATDFLLAALVPLTILILPKSR